MVIVMIMITVIAGQVWGKNKIANGIHHVVVGGIREWLVA